MLSLKLFKSEELMTQSGREFHSLIAEGKKENKYTLVLAARYLNLLPITCIHTIVIKCFGCIKTVVYS